MRAEEYQVKGELVHPTLGCAMAARRVRGGCRTDGPGCRRVAGTGRGAAAQTPPLSGRRLSGQCDAFVDVPEARRWPRRLQPADRRADWAREVAWVCAHVHTCLRPSDEIESRLEKGLSYAA